jgi:hypothetical protein
MACSTNPVWTFLLYGSPSSIMRSTTHREDLYDVTHSHRFSLGFGLECSRCTPHRGFQLTERICWTWQIPHRLRARVFRMLSTDGTSGGYYMSPHKKSFFLFTFHCIGAHALSCWRFVAKISTSPFFSFLVPRMCMVYHYLYCILPCYLPPKYPGLKVFKRLCKLDSSCPVIEISYF